MTMTFLQHTPVLDLITLHRQLTLLKAARLDAIAVLANCVTHSRGFGTFVMSY